MFNTILVTGGAGFIGGNFLLYMVPRHPKTTFINVDKLTYASKIKSLAAINHRNNYFFVQGDIADSRAVESVFQNGIDAVVHFAAESNVDRSIANPQLFVTTNILGTCNLLEWSKRREVKKFIHVSTDKVYGSLDHEGVFTELSPLAPNNPCSSTKAAADCMVRAYHKTHGLNVNITRSSNNYGPHQNEEKFIPGVIKQALRDEPVFIYGDGRQVRDWIYVEDHCRALESVLLRGSAGEVYNVGAEEEMVNLELAGSILHILGKSSSLLRFVEDRPGHDRRCAVNANKIRRELGWKPVHSMDTALKRTVNWYAEAISP